MRRILLGAAIFLAGMGVATAQPLPPYMEPDISEYAGGWVWYDNDQSNIWFFFLEQTEWETLVQRTELNLGFDYDLPGGGWRNGYVRCPVPNNAVTGTQSRSNFSARISDPSVNCEGSVTEYIGGVYTEGAWTYPIEITGYMSNPLLSIVEIETRSEIDNFYNETTRFQCQTVNGENVDGGGFSVLVPGTDGFRYFEFDSNYEASGMAHGQYNSQSCRKMTKTSK